MMQRTFRRFASKLYKTGEEALRDVRDGARLFVAGFGMPGVAENCLRIVAAMGRKDLAIYSNSIGIPGWGPGKLIDDGQLSKIVTSFIGGNPSAEKQYLSGKIEAEYVPQGSLVERMRCTQSGIAGFYSPTGVGTPIEFGGFPLKLKPDGSPAKLSDKLEKHSFSNQEHLLYPAFDTPEYAFVKAFIADKYGNLRYKRVARNFNPHLAGAGRINVAEAEHIVDRLPEDSIHTPGCFIDRVFQGDIYTHKIERLKVRYPPSELDQVKKKETARGKIIRRAYKELQAGMYINLGIGIPAEIPMLMPDEPEFTIQVENGLINAGQYPYFNQLDSDIINAAKEPIATLPGFSISGSSDAFGMMRGKHIHMTILGGFQVSEKGDLANWMIPGVRATGMGGAMDLASCVPRVLVTMEHVSPKGEPRIVPTCTYPLTAKECVTKVITELAVFEIVNQKMFLREKVKEISLEQLKRITSANYTVDPNLKDYEQPLLSLI